jgi:hypothetical protein
MTRRIPCRARVSIHNSAINVLYDREQRQLLCIPARCVQSQALARFPHTAAAIGILPVDNGGSLAMS